MRGARFVSGFPDWLNGVSTGSVLDKWEMYLAKSTETRHILGQVGLYNPESKVGSAICLWMKWVRKYFRHGYPLDKVLRAKNQRRNWKRLAMLHSIQRCSALKIVESVQTSCHMSHLDCNVGQVVVFFSHQQGWCLKKSQHDQWVRDISMKINQ